MREVERTGGCASDVEDDIPKRNLVDDDRFAAKNLKQAVANVGAADAHHLESVGREHQIREFDARKQRPIHPTDAEFPLKKTTGLRLNQITRTATSPRGLQVDDDRDRNREAHEQQDLRDTSRET